EDALGLAAPRQRAADWQPDLAVEETGYPRVHARDFLELGGVVEDDGHALARRLAQAAHHTLARGRQRGQQRAVPLGVAGRLPFDDEVRRDLPGQARLRARLALDLGEQAAGGGVLGLLGEHEAQVLEGAAGVVATVIQVG